MYHALLVERIEFTSSTPHHPRLCPLYQLFQETKTKLTPALGASSQERAPPSTPRTLHPDCHLHRHHRAATETNLDVFFGTLGVVGEASAAKASERSVDVLWLMRRPTQAAAAAAPAPAPGIETTVAGKAPEGGLTATGTGMSGGTA